MGKDPTLDETFTGPHRSGEMMELRKAVPFAILPIAFACLTAPAAGAVVYHVCGSATQCNTGGQSGWSTGNDTNEGTSKSAPFRTIQKAANVVNPGDRVLVAPGVYAEHVRINRSGTAGAPIAFEGIRGAGNSWLTIIDPSIPIESGWVQAPEVGAGVWKRTNMPIVPDLVTLDNKNITRYNDRNRSTDQSYSLLTQAANAKKKLIYALGDLTEVYFWDGVEVLSVFKETGKNSTDRNVLYIRFRNGDNPNGKKLRVATNNSAATAASNPAVRLNPASHIVFKNFRIRGAYFGLTILNESHHNVIEENHITNGFVRIGLYTGASNNILRKNLLQLDYTAFTDFGAWGGGRTYQHGLKQYMYNHFKFIIGHSDSHDEGIRLIHTGPNNQIIDNVIENGLKGILISGSLNSPIDGTVVRGNTLRNMSSIGLGLLEGQVNTRIHDNLISNCNYNFRPHGFRAEGEKKRSIYVYRNKSWAPEGVGSHIFVHFWRGTQTSIDPTMWLVHNSFSGGLQVMNISAYAIEFNGLPNVHFVNNIMSSRRAFLAASKIMNTGSMMGSFDFNYLGGPDFEVQGAWMGTNNVRNSDYAWSLSSLPDFQINNLPGAVDKGLDVSKTFTLRGKSYPALPGMSPNTFNGSAPDMGAVESGGGGTPTAPPHPADGNKDFKISLDEATAYGTCWRSAPNVPPGCPSGSNIATMDAAVRAGYLWNATKDGAYRYNAALPCPACWEPTP